MSDILIRAIRRSQNPQRVRRDGFAPGVIYGEGLENSLPVKFEMSKLKKLLKKKGSNAKIQIKVGEDIRYGIVKEIQRNPITGDITHIDIHLVAESNYIKMMVPIVFTGRRKLEKNKSALEVCVSEIYVSGRADVIPEFINIDIGDKKAGEKIIVADIKIDEQLKIINNEYEVIAVVSGSKTLEIAS